jgi:hypothetical protein
LGLSVFIIFFVLSSGNIETVISGGEDCQLVSELFDFLLKSFDFGFEDSDLFFSIISISLTSGLDSD